MQVLRPGQPLFEGHPGGLVLQGQPPVAEGEEHDRPGVVHSERPRPHRDVAGETLVPSRFPAAPTGPSALAARRSFGTRVTYTLNEAATVRFTVQRATRGRKSPGKTGLCGLKNGYALMSPTASARIARTFSALK